MKTCSKRRSVSQPTDSGTSGDDFTRSRSGGSLLTVQRKRGGSSSTSNYDMFLANSCQDGQSEAYSGMGGNASGGSVEGGHGLINIGSGRSSFQSTSNLD
jgi:hypothetical protein